MFREQMHTNHHKATVYLQQGVLALSHASQGVHGVANASQAKCLRAAQAPCHLANQDPNVSPGQQDP